jgi:hypothetical protein
VKAGFFLAIRREDGWGKSRGDGSGNDVPEAEETEGTSEMIAFKRDGLAGPCRGWSGVQGRRLGEILGGAQGVGGPCRD